MEIQKKGLIEKIVNILLNVLICIFGVILLISVYNNLQVKVFGKDYSDFFGYSVFEVQTGSMSPEINPGDWIIVKTSKNIQLKDVVTYKQDGEFITHRVIGAYNGTYVTKGDANNSKDEPIDESQIVGKVVKILANFGILKKTIFNPVVLAAIIITIFICNFVFQKKKQEDTKTNNFANKIINALKENNEKKKEAKENKKEIENQRKQEKQEQLRLEKLAKETQEAKKIEEKIIQEKVENVIEEPEYIEEISSYIPVDVSELDETFLEIAQNEIEEAPVVVEKKQEKQVEEEIEEKPVKLNLELLETGKKCKNVIEKFVSVKIEELNEIIGILDETDKLTVNEPTIKNKLMSCYIDSKYYGYYGNIEDSKQKQSIKIEKHLQEEASLLKKKYKGSDAKYSDKVDKFLNIFNVITSIEQAKEIVDKKAKEEYYKKELTKYSKLKGWNNSKIKNTISDLMKIQRNYVGIMEYLFKKLETNMFELEFNKLKTDKNMFGLSLGHNISFGKVYSDYIIDKTYNEGVIAESKLLILLNLLSIRLIKDMMVSNFDKKYIVYLPKTLYSKEKKLEKTLKMIDDEHAKESIVLLIKLEYLIKYKATIKKLKKDGYQFAIALTSDTKLESKNYTTMALADYIFVDKKIPNIVKTLSTLPEDVTDKLVYEDITEKIGDFGGEQ